MPEPTVEALLQEKRYADAIVEMVKQREHVTYVEIKRLLEGHMQTDGDVAITAKEYPAAVFWTGLSEELAEIMFDLHASKRIHRHPASLMAYMIDGGLLNLPIPKTMNFKKPHWLPVCYCSYPWVPKDKPKKKAAKKAGQRNRRRK